MNKRSFLLVSLFFISLPIFSKIKLFNNKKNIIYKKNSSDIWILSDDD